MTSRPQQIANTINVANVGAAGDVDKPVHGHQVAILPTGTILNVQQAAVLHQALNPNKGQQYTQQSPPSQHVHKLTDAGSSSQQQQPQQQYAARATISALATQLSSPPAMMSGTGIGQTFTLKNVNQPIFISSACTSAAIPVNINTNNRLLSQTSSRPEAMTVPSPGSDSNASSTSSTNLSIGAVGQAFNQYVATSPTASIISESGTGISGAHTSNNLGTSLLIERFHGSNGSMSLPMSPESLNSLLVPASPIASTSSQFITTANNVLQTPQPQTLQSNNMHVQSAVSISPITSPAPTIIQQSVASHSVTQQTSHLTPTTLNLQGINISNFSGMQNLQVNRSWQCSALTTIF